MWGNIGISGNEGFQKEVLKIWFKNEYMITWLNDRPYVTCPDTICVVDAKTAEGLSVWGQEFLKNREVVVFGRSAYKIWRTKRGIELFSPRHFGFDIGYSPIEDIVHETKKR